MADIIFTGHGRQAGQQGSMHNDGRFMKKIVLASASFVLTGSFVVLYGNLVAYPGVAWEIFSSADEFPFA